MTIDSYRSLQLLHELSENPKLTQRDLGRRVGLALGLINAQLHRFSTRGLIQIIDADIWKVFRAEDPFAIGTLPEEEITRALFAG